MSKATVYFTREISASALVRIYNRLGVTLPGRVAVKISTGEGDKSNNLPPALIGDLVRQLQGTIVEANTAYGGSRSTTADHKKIVARRGYLDIAAVDILDEEGEIELPVHKGHTRLTSDKVGSHITNYDSALVLSHFKGHAMAGFGGAIKNLSIGFASSSGKVRIHTAGTTDQGSIWYDDQDAFLESLAEAASAVDDYFAGKVAYINVLNRLSVDCDCDANPAEPDMHDIGILASTDPLAIDQASIDLVYAASDARALPERIESRHGLHTLEHAKAIGLGNADYQLINIDEE